MKKTILASFALLTALSVPVTAKQAVINYKFGAQRITKICQSNHSVANPEYHKCLGIKAVDSSLVCDKLPLSGSKSIEMSPFAQCALSVLEEAEAIKLLINKLARELPANEILPNYKPILITPKISNRVKEDYQKFYSDDTYALQFANKLNAAVSGLNTNVAGIRKMHCLSNYLMGFEAQVAFDACNKIFGKPTYSLAGKYLFPDYKEELTLYEGRKDEVKTKEVKVSSAPDADEGKAHKQCLDARDYEGCMRVKSTGGSGSVGGDKCLSDGITCQVTTKSNDSFGLPKPMGWWYTTHDGDKLVYWTKVYRVPHKGQQTRYLGMKRITRYYQNAKAGTAGSFTSGGTAFTNCTGSTYGTSVNCSTRGGNSRYIPGERATPGGVRNARFDSVYDCKDNTFANYEGKRIMYGGWMKNSSSGWAKLFKQTCRRGTNEIMKLDTMNVQM